MLADIEFQSAVENTFPLVSSKGRTVRIIDTYFHHTLDEDTETIEPINITVYEDDKKLKRVMDTHTFKEVFSLPAEFKSQLQPIKTKNINAAKSMRCIK